MYITEYNLFSVFYRLRHVFPGVATAFARSRMEVGLHVRWTDKVRLNNTPRHLMTSWDPQYIQFNENLICYSKEGKILGISTANIYYQRFEHIYSASKQAYTPYNHLPRLS